MPHEFKVVLNDNHCGTCGAKYHCAKCDEGTGGMGHSMTDERGWFYWCQDPERATALRRRWAMEQEIRERGALDKLLEKYGSPHDKHSK